MRPSRIFALSRVLAVVSLGLACLGTGVSAQTPPAAQEAPRTPVPTAAGIPETLQPDLAAPEVPDTFQIGADDLLSVFVFQMPELTSQVRVDSAGTIRLPMLSAPIVARGLTAPALAAEVGQAFVSAGIARNPRVQVIVRQVLSRPIVVMGAVKYPAVIEAVRPMYLTEILARAGGLDAHSGMSLLLTRRSPTGAPETQHIDLAQLMDSTNLASDPLLSGGEVVRVLPARMVYAVGALSKPGAFPVETGEPVTVLKALALAQGFSSTTPADRKHAEIIHVAASGARRSEPVNLDRILKHKAPDQELQAGDILYVPENGAHKLLGAALQDAAQTAVIAIGYHANTIF